MRKKMKARLCEIVTSRVARLNQEAGFTQPNLCALYRLCVIYLDSAAAISDSGVDSSLGTTVAASAASSLTLS